MRYRREDVEALVRAVAAEVLAADPAATAAPPARKLLAANWKMNLLSRDAVRYCAQLAPPPPGVEVLLCPPHILLPVVREALGARRDVALGAQNFHPEPRGAYTGEHSAEQLRDAGACYVIVGHSERRQLFREDDLSVGRKLACALREGLRPILCLGETLAQRQEGATFRVLRTQLDLALAALPAPAPDPALLAVAYEPVWAIGTGRNATAAQAQEASAFLRERLSERFGHAGARRVRILYGGSVTPDNARAIAGCPDVDGFLVGSASLDAAKFMSLGAALAGASGGGGR